MDEIGERFLPVDKDDGDPLAEALLELTIAGDVDLLELEGDLVADTRQHAARVLAEMAARGAVEPNGVLTGRAHG